MSIIRPSQVHLQRGTCVNNGEIYVENPIRKLCRTVQSPETHIKNKQVDDYSTDFKNRIGRNGNPGDKEMSSIETSQ